MDAKKFWAKLVNCFQECMSLPEDDLDTITCWGELVSWDLHDIVEKGQENCTKEEIENCGLLGIDFTKYSENPFELVYISSTENGTSGTITIKGEKYFFTFPVKLNQEICRLSTGKYKVTEI